MKRTEALYRQAEAIFGRQSQLDLTAEESAELIVALNHEKRGRVGPEAVIEEIADVQIMTEQAALMYGKDAVAKVKAQKLRRLRVRIDAARAKRNGGYAAAPK